MTLLKSIALLLAALLMIPTLLANTPNAQDIPTPVAYELVLTDAARNPTALVDNVGLTGKDWVTATAIIVAFNFDKRAHVDALNAQHETFEQFRQRCDELVAAARAQLRAKLTKAGMAKFDSYVDREKSHMQRHVGDRPLAGFES